MNVDKSKISFSDGASSDPQSQIYDFEGLTIVHFTLLPYLYALVLSLFLSILSNCAILSHLLLVNTSKGMARSSWSSTSQWKKFASLSFVLQTMFGCQENPLHP